MLDLNIVKQHLRLEQDFSDDDALIGIYVGAAVAHVEKSTRRKLYATEESAGYQDDADRLLLTDDVQAAMLLLIAFWYENREPVSSGDTVAMPFTVEALLQPYRIYGL